MLKNKITLIFVLTFALSFSSVFGQNFQNPQDEFEHISKLYQNSYYDVTAQLFSDFVSSFPLSPQVAKAQFMIGQSYFNLAKYEEARVEFLKVVNNYPDSKQASESWLMLSKTLKKLNRFQEAARTLEKIAIFFPQSESASESLFEASKIYEELEEYEKALKILEEVENRYSKSKFYFPSRIQKVSIYRNSGEFGKAHKELDTLTKTAKGVELQAALLYQRARVEETEGKIFTAQKTYTVATKKYPNTRFGKFSKIELGKLQRESGNLKDAEKTFLALAENKDSQIVLEAETELGKTYFLTKDYQKAIGIFEKVLPQNPSNKDLLKSLAESYYETNNLAKAEKTAKKGIQVSEKPSFEQVILLSKIQVKNNSSSSAILTLRTFADSTKKNFEREKSLFEIGKIQQEESKDFSGAIFTFKNFVQEFPESYLLDDVQFKLGECYEGIEDFATALYEYKRLVENFSGSEFFDAASEKVKFLQIKGNSNLTTKELKPLLDLVPNKPFEVGSFLHGIGDYEGAVSYLKKSTKVESIFLQGECFYALSKVTKNSQKSRNYASQAKSFFAKIAKTDSKLAEKSTIRLVEIEVAENPEQAITLYNSLLGRIATSAETPRVLLELAKAQISANSNSEALVNLENILTNFPTSEFFGEALALSGILQTEIGGEKAVTNLESYRAKFPKGNRIAEVTFALSKNYKSQKNYPKAVSFLNECVEKYFYSEKLATARLEIGDIFFEQKVYAKAEENYKTFGKLQEAQNLNLEEKIVSFKLGRTSFAQKKFGLAKNHFLTYLKGETQKPSKAIAMAELAESYAKLEETENAISTVDGFESEFKNEKILLARLLELQGNLYLEKGENANAYNSFNSLEKVAENDSLKMLGLVRKITSLHRQDKVSQAKKEIKAFEKKYKKIAPKVFLAEFPFELGKFYIGQKNFNKAKKEFERVTKKFDETALSDDAEFYLGKIQITINEIEKGLEILTAFPQKYPSSDVLAQVYTTLGYAYTQREQYDAAMKAYKNALKLEPNTYQNYREATDKLLEIYLSLRLFEPALTLCEKYLEKYPESDNVFDMQVQIGILYRETEKYSQGLELFQSILKDGDIDQQAAIQYNIAQCFQGLGELERAISEYLKVDFIGETKLEWGITGLYQAGLIYKQLGNFQQANNLFNKIIKRQGANDQFSKQAKLEIVE